MRSLHFENLLEEQSWRPGAWPTVYMTSAVATVLKAPVLISMATSEWQPFFPARAIIRPRVIGHPDVNSYFSLAVFRGRRRDKSSISKAA
jgi:hypothetical protein